MKIWLPSVRSYSGSDTYVERLAALLTECGCEPVVQWFPTRYEMVPWFLSRVDAPAGTDVIHANSWNAFAFARRGIPLIATVHHCVRGRGYPAWKNRFQSIYHDHWIARFETLSFARASGVIAVSPSTAAEVREEFALERIETIPNWLDSDAFLPSTENKFSAPSVLLIGNLSRRKGGDLLPEFRRLLDRDIELHVVAGRRSCATLRHKLGGNVRIWSRLTERELASLYQATGVTVCLSRYEGFGYTALEAMASGKPVIAFDVPGLRDVIVHSVTGILIPCGEVDALAAACRMLLSDAKLSSALGRAGRQRVLEQFSASRAGERYLSLYESVLARKP